MNEGDESPIALRVVSVKHSVQPGLRYKAVTVEVLYEHGLLKLVLQLPDELQEDPFSVVMARTVANFADRLKAAAAQPIDTSLLDL